MFQEKHGSKRKIVIKKTPPINRWRNELFFFQHFQQGEVEGWIVVEDELELVVGASDDAIEGAEGGAGLVGGLEVAGGVVEEAAVEDDGNAVVLAASGMAQVDGAAVGKGEAGTSCGVGKQGPAVAGEMAGIGAQVGRFVEIIEADTVAGVVQRHGADVKEVGDEGGQSAVDADFCGESGAAQWQFRMVGAQKGTAAGSRIKMQLRNGLVCQEQCGVAGLSGVGEGSQVGAAQVLGVVDEQKRKAAAKGCWMHVAKGMDGPAEPTAKVQLALAERRCMEQSRAAALGAHALYDVIKQQGFPGAGRCRKQKTSARLAVLGAKHVVFDRLLGGGEKVFALQKTLRVRKGGNEIIRWYKKLVRIGVCIECLPMQKDGDFGGAAWAQAVGVGAVGIEAILVYIGEKVQRSAEKAQVMVVGAHLPQNFFFLIGTAQRCFQLDVDDAVVAKAQQIEFLADAVDGITRKEAV